MSTKYKGTKSETSSLNAYIKLYRAMEKIRSGIYLILYKHEISETQFYILDALYHLGPNNQKALAGKVEKSGGNITMVVDNLEEARLVSRTRSKVDRRLYVVSITSRGKKLYDKIFPEFLSFMVKTFGHLSVKELDDLSNLSRKLGKS